MIARAVLALLALSLAACGGSTQFIPDSLLPPDAGAPAGATCLVPDGGSPCRFGGAGAETPLCALPNALPARANDAESCCEVVEPDAGSPMCCQYYKLPKCPQQFGQVWRNCGSGWECFTGCDCPDGG